MVTTVYKKNWVRLKSAKEHCNLLTGIKNALCPVAIMNLRCMGDCVLKSVCSLNLFIQKGSTLL